MMSRKDRATGSKLGDPPPTPENFEELLDEWQSAESRRIEDEFEDLATHHSAGRPSLIVYAMIRWQCQCLTYHLCLGRRLLRA